MSLLLARNERSARADVCSGGLSGSDPSRWRLPGLILDGRAERVDRRPLLGVKRKCSDMTAPSVFGPIAEARDRAMISRVVIEHGGAPGLDYHSHEVPHGSFRPTSGTASALRRRGFPLPANGRISVAPGGDCICHADRRPIVRPH
jgi:hypothetical protein